MRFFAIASIIFAAAVSVFATPVVERQAPASAAVVLTNLANAITPSTNQLLYATPTNATQDTLTPIIGSISSALNGAISDLGLLVGEPVNIILASVDGTTTLTASEIADLLYVVVGLVFTASNVVLLVVDEAIEPIIYALLSTLGEVVFSLMSIMLSLVIGLLSPLLILISPIETIIGSLGLTALLGELLGGLL